MTDYIVVIDDKCNGMRFRERIEAKNEFYAVFEVLRRLRATLTPRELHIEKLRTRYVVYETYPVL